MAALPCPAVEQLCGVQLVPQTTGYRGSLITRSESPSSRQKTPIAASVAAPVIPVIANGFGRHLVGSCQHDLPVRQRVPKWRTLQVFDEWEGYRGAGEWTRTTDLLITNKLLRGTVGGRFAYL